MSFPEDKLEALRKWSETLSKGEPLPPSLLLPSNPCPECETPLEYHSGMHCSGSRDDGSRWTGGADWAYCSRCDRWFEKVYSPFRPPPEGWAPSDGPPQPPDLDDLCD